MSNFPNWADHIIAFIFCVLIPLSAVRQNQKSSSPVAYSSAQKRTMYFSTCLSLFIMAAIIISAWLLFSRPLAEMGLSFTIEGRLWIWPLIAFVLIYAGDTINSIATPENIAAAQSEWKKRTPFMPTKFTEFPAYLLMCLCAGVFEEVIYRGYLVTYFGHLFSGSEYRQSLSVILPAIFFSISHIYHGAKNIMKIFILSVLFGYIFIQSGSLVIVMVLHFLTNVIGGLLTIKYMKEKSDHQDGGISALPFCIFVKPF